jgi:GNAT superfamily N-acetyltransferase
LHYKSTLHGLVDLYYLLPAYRKGRAGIRLFQEAERALRAWGVVKLQTATKLHAHLDMSRLLAWLGYTNVEKVYSKLL